MLATFFPIFFFYIFSFCVPPCAEPRKIWTQILLWLTRGQSLTRCWINKRFVLDNTIISQYDQYLISPHNINTMSSRQVVRIKNIINWRTVLMYMYHQILRTEITRYEWFLVTRVGISSFWTERF